MFLAIKRSKILNWSIYKWKLPQGTQIKYSSFFRLELEIRKEQNICMFFILAPNSHKISFPAISFYSATSANRPGTDLSHNSKLSKSLHSLWI